MKRFIFELDPLLRKHAWDLDTLSLEKIMASRAVSEQERELNTIETEILACSNSLIEVSGQDAEISIAQRQLVSIYLQYQHDLAADAKASLQTAQGIESQIADQLISTSQQVKALEKLRDCAKKKYDYLRKCAEFSEADEHWLAHHNPK